jgi:hypothetical protein
MAIGVAPSGEVNHLHRIESQPKFRLPHRLPAALFCSGLLWIEWEGGRTQGTWDWSSSRASFRTTAPPVGTRHTGSDSRFRRQFAMAVCLGLGASSTEHELTKVVDEFRAQAVVLDQKSHVNGTVQGIED